MYRLLIFIFFIASCDRKHDVMHKRFDELPNIVQKNFKEIYEYKPLNDSNYLAPFCECKNVENVECKIDLKNKNFFSSLIFSQKLVIKSAKKKCEVEFSNLERVYVIYNDSIYYPYTNKGGATGVGESRSKFIKIDTLDFISLKMEPM